MGYFSEAQSSLSDYFKSVVIDWLINDNNVNTIMKAFPNYIKNNNDITDFISDYLNDSETISNCLIELYVLSKLYDIPIIVYNDERTIIYIFDNGFLYNYKKNNKNKNNTNKKKSINIGLNFGNKELVPESIDIIYFQ